MKHPVEFIIRESGPAVLFTCASVISNPVAAMHWPDDLRKTSAALSDLLGAATAGGYEQGEILETLLSRGEVSLRTVEMARVAMRCAGAERIRAICTRHGM